MRRFPFFSKQNENKDVQNIFSEGVKCRKELLRQNQLLKSSTITPKSKCHFQIIPKKEINVLPPTITVNPGNYCYPLKENYLVSKEKNFFYRYYGEEKIEEVTKKIKSISVDIVNEIPDDLLSNLLFLILLKSKFKLPELKSTIINWFGMKKLNSRTINKRIQKLYDRYHSIIANAKVGFYHMSCGTNEEKEYENLIGTNKQLFCALCWIYDCNLHQQPESTFDSPQCYNVKEYLKTYRTICEQTFKVLRNNYPDLESGIKSNPYFARVNTNCEKYNSIIQENKLGHFSGYINLFEDKSPVIHNNFNNNNNVNINEKSDGCCGKYCYKNFLNLSESLKIKIYNEMSTPLPNIYELYLAKLIQIFKYDPCSISKAMKLVTLNNSNPKERLIECYVIYLRILSEDYIITKPLTKEVIDSFSKEKTNEKKKIIESNRLKIIKENAKNNKIIPYQPCFHIGNEACNDQCPCRARGFCEKYCACNKQLCKLSWNGCHCKGPCNSSLCPCFVNNRECDYDLCQNCKTDHSICKNQKLQKSENKKLGVSDSSIVGWGLFALEDMKKDDLIGEYIGEIVDMDDLNERSEYMDLENSTYMFTLNDEYTVDSRTMGNILRFANHSKSKANAYTKIVFANGNHRICLFANEAIKKHDEIFFNYDGQNILCDKYDWINDEKKTPKHGVHQRNVKANKNVNNFVQHKRKRKTLAPLKEFLTGIKKEEQQVKEIKQKENNKTTNPRGRRRKKLKTIPDKSVPNSNIEKIVLDFKSKMKKEKLNPYKTDSDNTLEPTTQENYIESKRESTISISETDYDNKKETSREIVTSQELLKKVFSTFKKKNGLE